jgi:hypothetical protein
MNPDKFNEVNKSTDGSSPESGQNEKMAPPPRSSRKQTPPDPPPTPKFITALYIILLSSLVFLLLQRYAIHGSIFPWPWHPLFSVSTTMIVDTGYAQYQGARSYSNAVAYLGIPYAEPPVGDRRFRAPLPLNITRVLREANGVVVDATAYPDFCIQGITAGKIYILMFVDPLD